MLLLFFAGRRAQERRGRQGVWGHLTGTLTCVGEVNKINFPQKTQSTPNLTLKSFVQQVKVTQSYWLFVTLWTILVHWILQARILEWVAFPFSWGSSQPRDWTQVSRIAGSFLTSWTTREAQEYWSGEPIPSLGDLPNPGIQREFPALQVDALPTELSGKPLVQQRKS